MILNVVFHGAWIFLISEAKRRIFAYTPLEDEHMYGVGSVKADELQELPCGDYELRGITGISTSDPVWYPNEQFTPMISAKRQSLKKTDPQGARHCYISMPLPRPVNIIPLEPYDTVGFVKGGAKSELKNLRQYPALHCFIYDCASLKHLTFVSNSKEIKPEIPPNEPPYHETANLHVFGTYWSPILKKKEDQAQMEKCFRDMATKLVAPELKLELQINPHKKIHKLAYALPPGLTVEEVELPEKNDAIGMLWGPGRNCQNSNLFVYQTDGMTLP